MIAALSGVLLHKDPGSVVIDVQGVGYAVQLSARTYDVLPRLGEQTFLHIHTSVREDAITLYGFVEPEEKTLFLLLNTVSGIGPKLALSILSGLDPAELCAAISCRDMARLTSLSGVGKKTAQRLCMELGEKVGAYIGAVPQAAAEGRERAVSREGFLLQDAASALVNLGYPQETAWQALRAVQQEDSARAAAMKVDELIREALRTLA